MWDKLLAGLVSPVTNYLGKRSDNKAAIIKQQVQRVMNSDDKEAELAIILAEGMKHSWKDEYWTVVLSIPAIASFCPDAAPHIAQGFLVLEEMPEFYQYWLGICVLTAFGMRLRK
jgi:hypothetical protein